MLTKNQQEKKKLIEINNKINRRNKNNENTNKNNKGLLFRDYDASIIGDDRVSILYKFSSKGVVCTV